MHGIESQTNMQITFIHIHRNWSRNINPAEDRDRNCRKDIERDREWERNIKEIQLKMESLSYEMVRFASEHTKWATSSKAHTMQVRNGSVHRRGTAIIISGCPFFCCCWFVVSILFHPLCSWLYDCYMCFSDWNWTFVTTTTTKTAKRPLEIREVRLH